MKICFVTHQYFPRHVGGTEVLTHTLAKGAIAAGHEVVVLTCVEKSAFSLSELRSSEIEYDGVRIIENEYNIKLMGYAPVAEYANPWMERVLTKHLTAFKPDLVHIMHPMKWSSTCLSACRRLGLKTVVTLTDYWFVCPRVTLIKWNGEVCTGPNFWLKCISCTSHIHDSRVDLRLMEASERRKKIVRERLLGADAIFALSHFQKKMFVRNGFPADRIEVIRHGVEDDQLSGDCGPHEPIEGLLRIGVIANVVPSKGIDVVLDALGRLPEAKVECTIYGALPNSDYVASIRTKAASDPRVRLAGAFAPAELGRVLNSMDVLAVPSVWYENDPLVLKSAQRVGLPALVSDIGSLSEMVTAASSDRLVKAGCSKAWADAIAQCIAVPPRRYPPQSSLSAADTVQAVLSLYHRLTGSSKQYANSPS